MNQVINAFSFASTGVPVQFKLNSTLYEILLPKPGPAVVTIPYLSVEAVPDVYNLVPSDVNS